MKELIRERVWEEFGLEVTDVEFTPALTKKAEAFLYAVVESGGVWKEVRCSVVLNTTFHSRRYSEKSLWKSDLDRCAHLPQSG